MRLPASKRSRSAWPGGLLGNSPLIVALSRTLIVAAMALSMGSAGLRAGDAAATKAAGAASSALSGPVTKRLTWTAAAGAKLSITLLVAALARDA